MQNTFGRFFEAACCCLVDWNRKAQGAVVHHHQAKRSSHHHHPKRSPNREVDHGEITSVVRSPNAFAQKEASVAELGASETKTLAMTVNGMDCPQCGTRLSKALLSIPSVKDVKVNSFTAQASLVYTEGLVTPEEIAKRATTLTGFACEPVQEVRAEGKNKMMRIAVVADVDVSWEKLPLPMGATVRVMTPSPSRHTVLDVEYDSSIIQPRSVLQAFSEWDGEFLPTPKQRVSDQASKQLRILTRRTVISALLCIPVLVFSWAPLPDNPIVYGGCSLALATLIQSFIAAPLYSSALRSLFLQRIIDMDLLVVLSSTIAFVFSAIAFFLEVANRPFSTPFFETPTLLITLITLGRLISAYARRRATSALDDIQSLQADTVELVETGGIVTTISAELVHKDDILRVSPDTLVPTDGVVVRGTSQVNESAVTGESMPVDKHAGSKLTAGSLNLFGVLEMRVDRVPSDNTVSDIGNMLLQVQDSRAPVQDLADQAASYLAPTILIVGILVFVVWMLVGVFVRNEGSSEAAITALRYAIAVLVISCPCALVLCVPMVVVISAAVGAKEGVLFKVSISNIVPFFTMLILRLQSVQAVQYAKSTKVVVFDKTGTLTTGQVSVVDSQILRADSIALILELTSSNRHPVAQAVHRYLREQYPGIPVLPQLQNIQSIPGKGIEARNGSSYIRGGSATWLGLRDDSVLRGMKDKTLSLFAVTAGDDLVAAFGLTDTIRPSAHKAIDLLRNYGTDVYIVSGDEQSVVSALAVQLNIPQDHAIGGCLPQTKQERVSALQSQAPDAVGGRINAKASPKAKVMFVGDGTNDSLALAQADVGVSLSSGTDIALSAADVVILDSDTADLMRAMQTILGISEGAVRRIMVNFAWALVYNVVAVLLAAGAFVEVRVAPEYAGLGEMVSVVPVVLVAWSMWLLKK